MVTTEFKDTKIGLIPSDWELVKLGDVLEQFQNGYAFSSKGYKPSGVPIVSMAAISLEGKFQFNIEKCKFWDESLLSNLSNFVLRKGDVIIAMTDVTPTKNLIGKTAQVNIDDIFLLNQRVGLLKFKKCLIFSSFFSYYGSSEIWVKYCRERASLGAQANLSTKDIVNSSIPLPPLPEQKKIAEILSTVDDKIDSIEQEIDQTRILKKGLMQKLLTGQLPVTGKPHSFKDSKLGPIPESWEVVKLSDTLDEKPQYGANASAVDYKDGMVRYIRITDIDETCRLIQDGKKAISDDLASPYILNSGDILIARTGNTVGKSLLFEDQEYKCAYAGYLIKFHFNNDLLITHYIKHYLQSQMYWNWIESTCRVGAQPNINSQEYQSFPLTLPPISEQEKIAEILGGVDDKLDVLEEKKEKYTTLKKGLMQKLLTGKIRVEV